MLLQQTKVEDFLHGIYFYMVSTLVNDESSFSYLDDRQLKFNLLSKIRYKDLLGRGVMKKLTKWCANFLQFIGLALALAIWGGSLGIPLLFLTPLIIPILLWSVIDKQNKLLVTLDRYYILPGMLAIYLYPLNLPIPYDLLNTHWKWLIVYADLFILWYISTTLDKACLFSKISHGSIVAPEYFFRVIFLIAFFVYATKAYMMAMPWIADVVYNLSCMYLHLGCDTLCAHLKSFNAISPAVQMGSPLCP